MNPFRKINESFEPLRYQGGASTALYWFYRIGFPVIGVLIVAIIAGVIYCKVNGIDIVLPF